MEAIEVIFEAKNAPLVFRLHVRRGDNEIGSGAIARNGNVPQGCKANQGFDVRVVRLRLERVPEEEQAVEVAFGDFRADLLVAAEWSAFELQDRQAKLVLDERARCAGGGKMMMFKHGEMFAHPIKHFAFAVVVRNECDALLRRNREMLHVQVVKTN